MRDGVAVPRRIRPMRDLAATGKPHRRRSRRTRVQAPTDFTRLVRRETFREAVFL